MKEMNVLICSASRKVALVKAFQKALVDLEMPGRVYAADIDPLSPALHVGEPVICPRSDAAAYTDWLMAFCTKHSIGLIVPTRDEELELLAGLKDRLNQAGVAVNVSSVDAVRTCRDKQKFYEYCVEHAIDVPSIYSDGKEVKFPCFVKGRFGKGGKFGFKVFDSKQLQALQAIEQDVIVQEYLDWPEYTVDYFSDFKGNPISVIPRLRMTTFGGESFVGKTVNNSEIIEKTTALCRELGLMGHNTVQLFYHPEDSRIKFIEINPRFGGGAALGIAAGGQTPQYLLRLALNQSVAPVIGDFQDEMYMLRYTEDLFLSEADMKR